MAIVTVVGMTFQNEETGINRQDIIKKLSGKERIFLRREPKNRFDKNAVAVFLRGSPNQKLGYIKAEFAGFLSELWKDNKFLAKIVEIRNGDETTGKSWGMSIEITKIWRSKNPKKSFRQKKKNQRNYSRNK